MVEHLWFGSANTGIGNAMLCGFGPAFIEVETGAGNYIHLGESGQRSEVGVTDATTTDHTDFQWLHRCSSLGFFFISWQETRRHRALVAPALLHLFPPVREHPDRSGEAEQAAGQRRREA